MGRLGGEGGGRLGGQGGGKLGGERRGQLRRGERRDRHGTSLRETKLRPRHHMLLLDKVVSVVRGLAKDPCHLLGCRLSHWQLKGARLLNLPDHRL